ncbi:putative 2-C-methyl-D-erythritol 2,4-cyclodiphosphate synthase [Acinetobacter sp. 1294243]|nr:putative 2-C-methyl-D-erythritol 2,4-cyclodiphosphate synthase [Acinetobacter sp. 1294243]
MYYSETEWLNTRFLKFLWKVIIYMVAQIRIGQGMDVHAFEEGNFVTLAGI